MILCGDKIHFIYSEKIPLLFYTKLQFILSKLKKISKFKINLKLHLLLYVSIFTTLNLNIKTGENTMAMMAKMRSLAPLFIISVGVLFVLFMVISDSKILENFGGRTENVGSINGEDISYKEFSQILEQRRQLQKSQTGKDIPEENMDQFREQVWDQIVTQTLFKQQIEKMGITVTDEEIKETILGQDPPEFLKQNFIDSTGRFNRQAYESALFDPRNKEGLIQAEEYVRQQKLNEKLQAMLLASLTVSEDQIRNKYITDNTVINAEYVLVNYNSFPDSEFAITDTDLKEYYDAHLDDYKIKAQRKLKYVLFPTTATSEDTSLIRQTLENVANRFKSDTASFKSYVTIYSDQPYSLDTVALSALPSPVDQLVSQAKPNTLIGPVLTSQGFMLVNYLKSIPSRDEIVKASHILINQFGDDKKNYAEAMKVYKEIKNGADFAEMAKKYSKDPGSAAKGGNLGWFGKGAMVPEFERAAFYGSLNQVQKPVKTTYGYHIIMVTGKSNKKYILEKIVNVIKPSPNTIDTRRNEAKDFAYLADKNDFDKEANLMKYTIKETSPFNKDAYAVPGLGVNKRIIDFAFNNSLGDISDVFRVQNGYVVVKISDVVNEHIRPLEEVKNFVKPQVLKQMKYEKALKIAEDIKAKIGDDLNKVSSINPLYKAEQTGSFPAKGSVPNIGRDYAFINKCLELDLNKVSEPVKGQRGYYLIKVLERTPFNESAYEMQRNSIRDNILQEKKSLFFSEWLAKLKKNADIENNLYLFYGE